MRYLTIGTIFKGDHQYLREWVEYHRIVGVEHFLLFCNDDDPSAAAKILSPYGNLITFVPFLGETFPIHEATVRMYEMVRGQTQWLLHIDLDEFCVPKTGGSIRGILYEYDHDPVGGVAIHWRVFNSSEWKEHPSDKLQIEAYVHRLPDRHRFHYIYKMAGRVSAVVRPHGSHQLLYKAGFHGVNELGERIPDGPDHNDRTLTVGKLQLNHYICRSRADYVSKIKRGWPRGAGKNAPDSERWKLWEIFHEASVFETEISKRFAKKVRKALGWNS